MGTLVKFPERSQTGAWLSGKARCSLCRHEWQAESPKGTDWLECPECLMMKARYVHDAIPKDDVEIWSCACGCDVFRVTRTSAFCINCATEQEF